LSQNSVEQEVLKKYKVIAVVGLSKDPSKDSYVVANYLKEKGYKIIPINPFANEILGEKCYASLLDMPEEMKQIIDVVDIFRPPQEVPLIVEHAIQLKRTYGKPHVVWMQIGIRNEEAALRARNAGLTVIMDRCMMMEHKRFMAQSDEELERIKVKKLRELMSKKFQPDEKEGFTVKVEDSTFDRIVAQNKLVVIDFWAAWCGPCRMLAPVVDELAKSYAGKILFGKLNVDENPATTERFNVEGIPTLIFLKDGEEVDRIVGVLPKEHIEAKLKKYLES
jgi:thioredoxin